MAGIPPISVARGSGPMAKAMSIVGLAIAGLLVVVFGLDLALEIPFGRANWVMDAGFVASAGLLGYMSWDALAESK